MKDTNRYLLVEAEVLPEVFRKVVEAKRLLAQGKAQTLSDAAKMAGISRSALYKYKDSVFSYGKENSNRIATIFCELMDEPGVLSSLLACLSEEGANIITINQNIPVDGVAPVSVSIRTGGLKKGIAALTDHAKQLDGVVSLRLLAGS